MKQKIEKRRGDWRVGTVLYQVFVDRFAREENAPDRSHLYPPPALLMPWDDLPARGKYLPDVHANEGALQFWGGTLRGVAARLDYVRDLGVQTIYLNPIFVSRSNHKYDTNDWFTVDPQYGTREDLAAVIQGVHERGMRLMLDGVFNHIGRGHEWFRRALEDENAPERDYFFFGSRYKGGVRGWRDHAGMPELNLENTAVRSAIQGGPDSVVRWYLREMDIDGWRIDVAPDVGLEFLREMTEAAHDEKADSTVVGECWNYPEEWLHVVDGVMNMHVRELLLALAKDRLAPRTFCHALRDLMRHCDYEGLLRSHLVLDNHDVPRLASAVPDPEIRRLLRVLQFTLPGCPVIYYGSELGMTGGEDPLNRAPMRWDLLTGENEELRHLRMLVGLREDNPALSVGDCRIFEAEHLISFMRTTEYAVESLLVAVNLTSHPVEEMVPVPNSRLMDQAPLECLLSGERVMMHSGTATLSLPPRSARIFRSMDQGDRPGYSMFKRVL